MKTLFSLLLFMTIGISASAQHTFLKQQLKFERVRSAYAQEWEKLKKELDTEKNGNVFDLYVVAYKAEGILELWLKVPSETTYSLFKTYDFCEHSGTLGPKVVEGDLQTPEGFYKINVFNPESSYHLSLGIDYPNAVDLARTGPDRKPGGDIYIHGNCVTVGCIPLTDEKIREVYLLAALAKNNGEKEIPVSIFPFKMTDGNLKSYGEKFPSQISFWQTLQPAYRFFQQYHQLPKIVQEQGKYLVK